GPEGLDLLEADAEPDQATRYTVAFPAVPRFEHRVDAAEARRVRDQLRRRLDPGRIAAHVEREQPAEAAVHVADGDGIRAEARIAEALDRGMTGQAPGELERSLRLALHPHLQRLQRAQEEPGGVGRRDRPGQAAQLLDRFEVLLASAGERAEQDVVVTAEVLGRAV